MERISAVLADRGEILISVVIILSTVFIASRVFGSSKHAHLPIVGKEYGNLEQRRQVFLTSAKKLYDEGYDKYRDQAYRLTTMDGDRVVVPNSALEELRRLSDDYIDNRRALDNAVEKPYTKIGGDDAFLNHMVRSDLTRNLSRINPHLSEEAVRTVDEVLGPCEDWTKMPINQKMLRMVAIISGHIFLGPDLCRREEYLHASINYTVDLFAAVRSLKRWHPWLRPIGQYFTPELVKVPEHRQRAREFLLPIIQARKASMARGDEELPDDMLQWMLNKAAANHVSDADMSDTQLTLSLAAIHTTTMTATEVLCQLVLRPELVRDLREEIRRVLGANNGVMTTHALFEMKLLDSVMRETQRCNPGNQVRFTRYVKKSVTLSNGLYIPAGTRIETPFAPVTSNPNLYPEPEKFDAYRFVNLRDPNTPDPINYKNREQYQFIAVTKEHMAFGYGPHACPGRFFAANEIKLILARMLLMYDMRLPNGIKELPPRIVQGQNSILNPTVQFELKKAQAKV